MSILTYADLSSLDLTWFDEECQINLRVYFNRAPALVRYNIYETVTNLWEDIVEAESNNLAWPDWYELPSIRIHIGRTSRENELQNSKYMRLGKYHLGGLYPVENWKEYWVDRQKDDFEMEIFWYDCHHYPETILPTQKLAAKSIYPEEAATPQVTTGNVSFFLFLYID